MPAVIPLAIAAATAGTEYAVLGMVLSAVSSAVISSYQSNKANAAAKAQFNASQVDRMENVMTAVAPRELVLGRVRKGGTVAFRGTAGEFQQKFIAHLVLAAHEIDGIEEVWFNDVKVTVDPVTHEVQDAPYMLSRTAGGSGFALGTSQGVIPKGSTSITLTVDPTPGTLVAAIFPGTEQAAFIPVTLAGRTVTIDVQETDTYLSYSYTQNIPRAWVFWDLGAPGAVADWTTQQWFPDLWTNSHRGEGIAKLMVVFDYDETAFPNGVPSVTVIMRGAKVYDPRDGVTRWSENPAVLARHVYQHPYFGKATVSASEDARFIAAANACDVSHTWTLSDGTSQTSALYRAGVVVQYGTTASSVLNDLTQAMAGMWAFSAGEMFIRAGTYTAPVMTFGDADLAVIQRTGAQEQQDKITIAVHRDRASKFNVVNATIWDSQQGYKQAALTPLKSAALIAADDTELPQQLTLSAVYFAPQALHVCGVMMRDARDPLTITVPLKMTAFPVELLDTVQMSFSRYGWNTTPKTFMVLERTWDRMNGVIRLQCKETNAAIYTPDAAFLAQGYALNTALATPWDILPPGTLSIDSGKSDLLIASDGTVVTRVRVSWPAIADQRITNGGHVEVQWCNVADGNWNSILVDGNVTSMFITGASDGMAIAVRARTRTSLAISDWGTQQTHIVIGKTEPPAPPTGVSVTQSLVFFKPPSDLDLAGVRIRSIPGGVAAPVFSRGTDVIAGLVASSPARLERQLYGVQTIVVVAEDTSGNQSDPAFSVFDFGQPSTSGAVWERIFENEAFPGTYTSCSLVGGAVVADTLPTSDEYLPDNLFGEPDVYATQYQAMTWQSGVVIAPYAGTLALTEAVSGNAPTVEYRISGDTITDLYASSDVYAAGDDFGAPGQWALWPGALQVGRATPVEFLVQIATSAAQGQITDFTLSLIMELQAQTFASVSVSSAGTRLVPSAGNPARNWIASPMAYGWPVVDGSGAMAGRTLDSSPVLGPLVQFVDNTGTPVTAVGTVKVEGFSDE